jgi:hypothetical protein
VWNVPAVAGQAESPRTLGGVVTPVLAGFALATVALLVSGDPQFLPRLHEQAVLAFAVAVGLLLAAMQFSSASVRYASRPTDRLDLVPEARVDLDKLNFVRKAQHRDRYLEDVYYDRARYTYNLGLMAFLVGLGLIVWPDNLTWSNWARVASAAVVVLSVIVELIWTFSTRLGGLGRWLFPDYESVPDNKLGADLSTTDPAIKSVSVP